MDHPLQESIEAFVLGRASGAENRRLVRHLLRGCPDCQDAARVHWNRIDALARRTLAEMAEPPGARRE